jgi:hypothetical protein
VIADRGCAERGCACYDPRIDTDGVEMTEVKANELQIGGTHYKDMGIQPWEVMEATLTREEFIGYLKGNCIKYGMRAGKKDSDDAGKFRHYHMKLNELLGTP